MKLVLPKLVHVKFSLIGQSILDELVAFASDVNGSRHLYVHITLSYYAAVLLTLL